ncbi:hypothetical protein K490DRAFT_69884 [Saccharata proteae CBS 121410]|uniref:Glycoside hydrolase protein n=1 Tax=Saccharata proteae CBS 121410 TaxID=1314787 RepID=A0A9P4HN76_9PEZI|nr:hypothetical protein K490DRAFT_69884 [Saccharata proteae CBS 121410]
MGEALPSELIGLAVIVNVLSFGAVLLGFLCIFMLYRHEERFSYILLLSIFCTLGGILGLIQHMDYTMNWKSIMIARWQVSQKPSYNSSMMLGKSDPGWRSILSWMTIYCYNVDSLLVLFWAITLFIGTFNIRMRSLQKKVMSIILKITATSLPAVMLGIASIDVVHNSPAAFLVVINAIMFSCLTLGSMLVLAVLYKYLLSREIFKRIFAATSSMTSGSTSRNATSTTASGPTSRSSTDKWLIVRFGVIMAILLIFEAAVIVYELVNFRRNQQETSTPDPAPDLSMEQTRVDLIQYIPGAAPPIIAFLVFGTTATFRKEYAKAFRRIFCCMNRSRGRKAPRWLKIRPHTGSARALAFRHGDVEMIEASSKESGHTFNVQESEVCISPIPSAMKRAEADWLETRPVQPVRIQRTTSFSRTSARSPEPLYSVAIWSGNRSSTTPSLPRRFQKATTPDTGLVSPRNLQQMSPGDFWRPSTDALVGASRPRSVSAGPTLVSTQPPSRNGLSPKVVDASTLPRTADPPGSSPRSPSRNASRKAPLLRLHTDADIIAPGQVYRSAQHIPPVPPIPAATHWRQNSIGDPQSPLSRSSTSSTPRKVGFSEPLVIPSVLPSVIRESDALSGPNESYLSLAPSESSAYTSSLSEEMHPAPLFSPTSSYHSRSGSATPVLGDQRDGARRTAQYGGSLRPPSPVSFAHDSVPRRPHVLRDQASTSSLLFIQGTEFSPNHCPAVARPPSPPTLPRLNSAPPAAPRRSRTPPPVPLDVFDGPL